MRIFLLSLLLCISFGLFAQDTTTCKVFQFFGADSSRQEVVLKMTYNNRGKIVYKYEHNYSTRSTVFLESGNSYWYIYSDTLLTEIIYQPFSGTKTKTVYAYENGRMIRESRFNWELDQTPPLYHPPGMPGVSSEPQGKWNQVSEARITYDPKGRKISWDASRLHNETINVYKWEYDDQDRLVSYKGFRRGGQIALKRDYQYFDWGYRYWTAEYNEYGELRHELEPGQGHSPMIVHTITLKDGKIIEDKESDEKSNPRGKIVYSYDRIGRVLRDVCYDQNGEKIITHIYQYN